MEFVIARNPDADSSLLFLVRLPLGPDGVALKVRDTWPRTAKVYCHRAEVWPAELDIIGGWRSSSIPTSDTRGHSHGNRP